jgi:hypothetical protein
LEGKPGEKEHLEDICVDGRISLRIGLDGLDRTDGTEERGRWRALVDNVMNIRVPRNAWNFWNSSHEEFCFMHLDS